MKCLALFAKALSLILPWPVRRWYLCTFFGYKLDRSCRIGLSWIFPKRLIMESGARIGHLNVCKGLSLLHLKESTLIGNLNWVTGYPEGLGSYFEHNVDRKPALILERHSAVTHRHLIDCTDQVTVGEFSTVAGFHSKILTHSIDLKESRQSCAPVKIGCYCFLGTNCIVLGGAVLPNCSILGAGAVLQRSYAEPYQLYAGVPARPVKELSADWAYFSRLTGHVS